MESLSIPHLLLPLALLTGEGSKLGFCWEWKLCGLFIIGTIMAKILRALRSEVNTDAIFPVCTHVLRHPNGSGQNFLWLVPHYLTFVPNYLKPLS